MKKLDVAQTLQIVANAGVIAGIIFLAIEINQNNEQLRLQSYQSWAAANMELNMAALDPSMSAIFEKGNLDASKLTKDNYVSFAMWQLALMQMAQTTDYLYRAGSLDRDLWESEINRAAGILAAPGVRQWWEAGGKTQVTPQFVDMIESVEPSMNVWGWEEGQGFVTILELSSQP